MRVLVTGANGYLGKGVVKSLLDDGVEVIATDFRDAHIDKRATIIKLTSKILINTLVSLM